MTKMYKLTVYVVDSNENIDIEAKKLEMEEAFEYDLLRFGKCKTVDIGEFNDDHILNNDDTPTSTFKSYFKEDGVY